MNEMDFEGSLKRLEEIVNILQQGNLSLEESVRLFEEGIRLSNFCRESLLKARMRVDVLINDNGEIKEMRYKGEQGEEP